MKGRLILALLLSGLLLGRSFVSAVEFSSDQIIAEVDELINSTTGKYTAEITIIRPGKDDRTSKVEVFIKGISKVLVRYLAPAQEKGQGYLRLNDDEWLFLPNANKSIRVSGRQNMQGSDLANDDLLKVKLTEDYTSMLIGTDTIEGVAVYMLELTARNPAVAYGRLKYWVRQSDFIPIKTEYYAISGKMLKTAIYDEVIEIGGKVRPARMEISSALRKGYKTVFTIIDADYKYENPDSIFTRMYLEKGK